MEADVKKPSSSNPTESLTGRSLIRETCDIRVMLAEMRADIKNLKRRVCVIAAVLCSTISCLLSRIPI